MHKLKAIITAMPIEQETPVGSIISEGSAKMQPQTGITRLICLRCDHEWTQKVEVVKVCPKCKSPYWNLPRTMKEKNKWTMPYG